MNQKHNRNTELVQKHIYKGSIDCLIKVCPLYLEYIDIETTFDSSVLIFLFI